MFPWAENFETHIEIIDIQHKKLVSILNELCTVVNGHELTQNKFDDILKQLLDYAAYHFEDEEKLMLDYKVSEKHIIMQKMEHRSFIYDIERMRNYFSPEASITQSGEKLIAFITAWLTYHILGIDKGLAAQINDIKQGMDPEKAYQKNEKGSCNKATMRLLLDSVLKMWEHSNEYSEQLEQKVLELEQQLAQCLSEKNKP